MKYRFFALFLCAAIILPAAAKAEPKFLGIDWWPSHWENLTFQPYLDDPKHPHNTQWDSMPWESADWAAQRSGGSDELIRGFYRAGILSKQYMDDDMPVLRVGPNFYNLSSRDKRRVTKALDDHFQITASHLNGMFLIEDWRTRKPIGTYTAHGLHLQ